MNLLTIFLVIISLHIFRRKLRIIDLDCDDKDISPSDYTILVKDIPINFEDPLNDDYQDDL